jgi:two-component SAPR family response regulator
MNDQLKYIIVDDDSLNNTITSLMLKRTLHEVGIDTFTLPKEGLVFIQNSFKNGGKTPSVLFLDIDMPILTGWDFLGHFDNFSDEIRDQISIYMLSSSINQRDRDKAKKYKCVKGFISKPITTEIILSIAVMRFDISH